VRDLTIVTGGSSGIGAELARQAAEDGHDVLVVSRRSGPFGRHLSADLSHPDGWDRLSSHLVDEIAAADTVCLFHSAGTLTPIGFAGEVDQEAYRNNILLNAAAPPIIGDAFLRAVRLHPIPATLVMLTSGAARTAYPGWSGYCAGKAAVDHWTRAAGSEQAERSGAKVVAIAPGVVDTPMQAEIRSTDEHDFPSVDRFHQLHSDGDLGDPADVARRIRAAIADLDNGAVIDLRDL
jgi:benzil reductase ((S)-benzoin forming)